MKVKTYILPAVLVILIIVWQWDFLLFHNAIGPVLGSFIGVFGSLFGVNIGSDLSYRLQVKRQKEIDAERKKTNAERIIEELKKNYELIGAKKKTLETIIHVTGENNYPIGWEIPFFSKEYDNLIGDVSLTSKEKNALHIIYYKCFYHDSFIRVIDEHLYDLNVNSQGTLIQIIKNKSHYLLININDIEKCIKKYLDGNPDDSVILKVQ